MTTHRAVLLADQDATSQPIALNNLAYIEPARCARTAAEEKGDSTVYRPCGLQASTPRVVR